MSNWTEDSLSDQQREWLEAIRACSASGKTMKAFAESKGLSLQDFYAWKKTFVQKWILPRTRGTGFQRVQVVEAEPAGVECRLLLPNGVTVILTGHLKDNGLTQLLQSAMAL